MKPRSKKAEREAYIQELQWRLAKATRDTAEQQFLADWENLSELSRKAAASALKSARQKRGHDVQKYGPGQRSDNAFDARTKKFRWIHDGETREENECSRARFLSGRDQSLDEVGKVIHRAPSHVSNLLRWHKARTPDPRHPNYLRCGCPADAQ